MADPNDDQRLLPAQNIEAHEDRVEGNPIQPPRDDNGDGEMENDPEAELNAWLNIRECLQREKILGFLSCAAFGGTTSAFLSSSLELLKFLQGHPPAIAFIIPILGWTGIGSGAHLALRNRVKFCLIMWPISLVTAFALMRYGASTISTSIMLLFCLALANFFGCSLCACLLMNAEYVLPSLGPLLMYRHIPTLSIMISSVAGWFSVCVPIFILTHALYTRSVRGSPHGTHCFSQFKTDFEIKQASSPQLQYPDEIMGVSGYAAVAFFSGSILGGIFGFIMPCMWWLIFFLGSLLDYLSFLYRLNLPRLLRRLPLPLQRFFGSGQALHVELQ